MCALDALQRLLIADILTLEERMQIVRVMKIHINNPDAGVEVKTLQTLPLLLNSSEYSQEIVQNVFSLCSTMLKRDIGVANAVMIQLISMIVDRAEQQLQRGEPLNLETNMYTSAAGIAYTIVEELCKIAGSPGSKSSVLNERASVDSEKGSVGTFIKKYGSTLVNNFMVNSLSANDTEIHGIERDCRHFGLGGISRALAFELLETALVNKEAVFIGHPEFEDLVR